MHMDDYIELDETGKEISNARSVARMDNSELKKKLDEALQRESLYQEKDVNSMERIAEQKIEIDKLEYRIKQISNELEKWKKSAKESSWKKEIELKNQELEELGNLLELREKQYGKQMRSLERAIAEANDNLRTCKMERDQLKRENHDHKKSREELLTRLSKVAGSRLTYNNPAITDLGDEHRGTKLAEQFSELYDTEWTDSLEELLNTGLSEDDAIQVIYKIVVDVYIFCCSTVESYKSNIIQSFTQLPNSSLKVLRDPQSNQVPFRIDLSTELFHQLEDIRKELCPLFCDSIVEAYSLRLPTVLLETLELLKHEAMPETDSKFKTEEHKVEVQGDDAGNYKDNDQDNDDDNDKVKDTNNCEENDNAKLDNKDNREEMNIDDGGVNDKGNGEVNANDNVEDASGDIVNGAMYKIGIMKNDSEEKMKLRSDRNYEDNDGIDMKDNNEGDGDGNTKYDGDENTNADGDGKVNDDGDSDTKHDGTGNTKNDDDDENTKDDDDENVEAGGDGNTKDYDDKNTKDDGDENTKSDGDRKTKNDGEDDHESYADDDGDVNTKSNSDGNTKDDGDTNIKACGDGTTTYDGDENGQADDFDNTKDESDSDTQDDGDGNITGDGDSENKGNENTKIEGDGNIKANDEENNKDGGIGDTKGDVDGITKGDDGGSNKYDGDWDAKIDGGGKTKGDGDGNTKDDDDKNDKAVGVGNTKDEDDGNTKSDGDWKAKIDGDGMANGDDDGNTKHDGDKNDKADDDGDTRNDGDGNGKDVGVSDTKYDGDSNTKDGVDTKDYGEDVAKDESEDNVKGYGDENGRDDTNEGKTEKDNEGNAKEDNAGIAINDNEDDFRDDAQNNGETFVKYNEENTRDHVEENAGDDYNKNDKDDVNGECDIQESEDGNVKDGGEEIANNYNEECYVEDIEKNKTENNMSENLKKKSVVNDKRENNGHISDCQKEKLVKVSPSESERKDENDIQVVNKLSYSATKSNVIVDEQNKDTPDKSSVQFGGKDDRTAQTTGATEEEKTEINLKNYLHTTSFASKCAKLCWLMRIKNPPITIAYDYEEESDFDTNLFKHYTRTGTKMKFVVWPALYLYENGPLLSKGVAQPF